MLEKRTFQGGVDKDSDVRLVQPGDYRDALNVQAGITAKGSIGAIEKVRGNALAFGAGFEQYEGDVCIGGVEDKVNRKIYYFLCNTINATNHRVIMCDYSEFSILNQLSVIAHSAALNFNKDYLITGANVIDSVHLYWTDDYNEPSKIYLPEAENGFYLAQQERQYFDAIPHAPLFPPVAEYQDDTTITYNNMKGALYQFKYRYIYKDGTKSAFSPTSKVTIPQLPFNYAAENYLKDNSIKITLNSANNNNDWNVFVEKIEISVRSSNTTDFYTIEKANAPTLNGSYVLDWKNNTPLSNIVLEESNALYSFVPLKAKSQELIGSNRLSYGNFVEGYDNLPKELNTSIDNVNYSAYPIYTGNLPNGFETFVTPGINVDYSGGVTFFGMNYGWVGIQFTPNPNRVGTYSFTFTQGNASTNFDYNLAASGYNNTPTANYNNTAEWVAYTTAQHLIGLGYSVGFTAPANFFYILDPADANEEGIAGGLGLVSSSITGLNTVVQDQIPIKSLKRGAAHKFGLVYYDKSGRSGLVQELPSGELFVDPATQGSFGQVSVGIDINHRPPEWATTYQVVYGGNSTYLRDDAEGRSFVQYVFANAIPVGNDGLYDIAINGILEYAERTSTSAVNYGFTEGDRFRIIQTGAAIDGLDLDYLPNLSDVWDARVVSYDSGTSLLRIDLGDTPFNTSGFGRFIGEIYSPSGGESNSFYREIGEVRNIINAGLSYRSHESDLTPQSYFNQSPARLVLDFGDVWIKVRDMSLNSGNVANIVEESNFNDKYISHDFDYGRPNIVDEDFRQLRRNATIRYSDVYIPDTNFNGLGTFFDLSFADYEKDYGSIQRLYSEDKRLIVFQELKVGQAMVNESILRDATGEEFIQKSDTVLSDIQYYGGEFGISDCPESFAVYGFAKYFVDKNRGAVLRLSNNGITKISDYKMHTYFTDLLRATRHSNKRTRIVGVYNEVNSEYILSIDSTVADDRFSIPLFGSFLEFNTEVPQFDAVTWSFSEATNRWTSRLSFTPEMMIEYGTDYATFRNGELWVHNWNRTEDRYGNFYNTEHESSIDVVFNQNPSNMKFYKTLEIESNLGWHAPLIYNELGQESELILGDFDKIENIYWAQFLRDVNTPNITLPLISGDDLRSQELIVRLQNDGTDFAKLFSVGAKFEGSELSNR